VWKATFQFPVLKLLFLFGAPFAAAPPRQLWQATFNAVENHRFPRLVGYATILPTAPAKTGYTAAGVGE
jgi:hypothetical protein